jgi:nucleoside-diphosphate-sugar epimerase
MESGMASVLVTGAAGFVGRHLIKELVARGEAVRALVRDPGKPGGLTQDGCEVVCGDILDAAAMARAVRDVDVVFHCAAVVGAGFRSADFQEVNVEGTRSVLSAARAEGCRRVVLLSSLHVLGIGNLNGVTEHLPCRRTNDDAANAKIDMEQMALAEACRSGPEVVILRPGVIYGAGDPHNLPKLVGALMSGGFFYLGSRRHIVPIVHVDDVARAMILAAHAPDVAGRIYHITDGSRTTIRAFVEHLAELAGCRTPRWVIPGVLLWPVLGLLSLARRIHPRVPQLKPGTLRFLATSRFVDIRRARDELGYAPLVGFRAGLAATLQHADAQWPLAGAPEPADDTELRARVEQAIRPHLRALQQAADAGPMSPERIDEVARAALAAMLTRPFRIGPFPPPEVHARLFRRVRRRVARGQPIYLSVGFGAVKNPNGVAESRADWAEFFALSHLIALHNKVQLIYPPGLSIRLIFDDVTHLWANRGRRQVIDSYISSIKELIRVLEFDRVIVRTRRLSSFAWICRVFYPFARRRVRRWERDPSHAEQLQRMSEAARRNLALWPGLDDHMQERIAGKAAHRYRVFWEALRLSGISQTRRRIVAMYLDGSQHHIAQPLTLHLTTLDKGQMTQPWQGCGVLHDNGHGRLEPYVLTASRRARSVIRHVGGLDFIPLPGFDRIAVVWPAPAADAKPVNCPAARAEPTAAGSCEHSA